MEGSDKYDHRYTGRHDHGTLPALKSGGPHGQLIKALLVSLTTLCCTRHLVRVFIATTDRHFGPDFVVLRRGGCEPTARVDSALSGHTY